MTRSRMLGEAFVLAMAVSIDGWTVHARLSLDEIVAALITRGPGGQAS